MWCELPKDSSQRDRAPDKCTPVPLPLRTTEMSLMTPLTHLGLRENTYSYKRQTQDGVGRIESNARARAEESRNSFSLWDQGAARIKTQLLMKMGLIILQYMWDRAS